MLRTIVFELNSKNHDAKKKKRFFPYNSEKCGLKI